MANWNAGTESGILRKKKVVVKEEKHDDLLVFGYECKIYRDDEKALYIDHGKHLVPWIGDETLKIDRFDCRCSISELTQYEATGEDYEESRWLSLDEKERKTEILCDEERYYSLRNNEEELEMYQEEEVKRLYQKGSEVQYNYDVPIDPKSIQQTCDTVEEENKVFIPSPDLNLPPDIQVPKTVKENTRIEKTALFISQQGLQMEIFIKTKQSNNPQLSFMNKDDVLYPYYKHLLEAIKSGVYKVESLTEDNEQKQEESFEQDEQSNYYLHPSLQARALQSAPPPLPTVIYKPSADCSYFQLVNRIQGAQSGSATPPPPPSQPPQVANMTYEQQQQYYQQFYYTAQYYEYYKQMAQFSETNSDHTKAKQEEPYNGSAQAAYAQYFQSSTNPYAQIVSNLSATKETSSTYISENAPQNEITKAPILYNQSEVALTVESKPVKQLPQLKTEIPKKSFSISEKPVLPLVMYGSDSENSESEEETLDVECPPSEICQVIEKMANYVAKNGRDFETIVKSKGDPRFEFLYDSNKYHNFYKKKIKEYSNQTNKVESETTKEQKNGIGSRPKEKKAIAPVSFSIKKVKEDVPKEIKSALPVEESDEDQEESLIQTTKSVSSLTTIPAVTPVIESSTNVQLLPKQATPIVSSPKIVTEEKAPGENCVSPKNKTQVETDDLILDLIDLTNDLDDKRESRTENSQRDKIVSEAKEKLALQLERKRKAAAFLKLKSASSTREEKRSRDKQCDNDTRKEKRSRDKQCDNDELEKKREKRAKIRENYENEVLKVEDSESEEGEIKKHKKSSKKKKSHKRKHSESRYESSSRHRSKDRKKAKKKHKREYSSNSRSSESS